MQARVTDIDRRVFFKKIRIYGFFIPRRAPKVPMMPGARTARRGPAGDWGVSVGDCGVSASMWVGMTMVFAVVTGGAVVPSFRDTNVGTGVMAGPCFVRRTLSTYPRA